MSTHTPNAPRLVVTGATGFIGQHVVAELQCRGIKPLLMIRSSSALPEALKEYPVVEADLHAPPTALYEKLGQPDLLIHLAWNGLPNYKSLHHFESELPAHYLFLKGLLEAGLPNLVVTGTCFEYGMQSGVLHEEMESRPDNPYGFAKETLRRQMLFLQQKTPFNLTWARLFYLFGEGQGANSLLPQLRHAVESGASQFNMSGGEQLRDYLPVKQVARYLVDLALTSRYNHGLVNICSGQPISVRRLVENWIHENGWPITLNLGFYPYPNYEPMAFWGDRSKLERCLTQR
ncbi:MAG: NAD(P)-dependent oxidoreductase [Magnetococcales bacterium]|nr:NAD(P)-dependent oxidoreductase [Magnetococcales bacterium]MBF0439100.1 NAD(P)-dependent oxidoreductase [Magnetococcales bacterium]